MERRYKLKYQKWKWENHNRYNSHQEVNEMILRKMIKNKLDNLDEKEILQNIVCQAKMRRNDIWINAFILTEMDFHLRPGSNRDYSSLSL